MILLLRKVWKRTGPSGLRGTRPCRTPARLSTSRLTTFSTLPSWIGYFYMFDCKTNPGQINHLNQIRDCGSDFPWDLDVSAMFKVGKASNIFDHHHRWHHSRHHQEWHHNREKDILTYRDKSFASKFTGTTKCYFLLKRQPRSLLASRSADPLNIFNKIILFDLHFNHVFFPRHSVSNPPHQLHVRPWRLSRHVHASNQEVKIENNNDRALDQKRPWQQSYARTIKVNASRVPC